MEDVGAAATLPRPMRKLNALARAALPKVPDGGEGTAAAPTFASRPGCVCLVRLSPSQLPMPVLGLALRLPFPLRPLGLPATRPVPFTSVVQIRRLRGIVRRLSIPCFLRAANPSTMLREAADMRLDAIIRQQEGLQEAQQTFTVGSVQVCGQYGCE